jgi:hypothetical protein
MLEAEQLPACIANLDARLAEVDADNFAGLPAFESLVTSSITALYFSRFVL